jgi:WD40 repeat protein
MVTISRGRIFICYRRRDTRDLAGRISDSLITHFGEDDIFMDVDAIEPGLDFASEITKAVASCDILLAVIGPRWLTITDSAGRRRLDNPADFVRLEIETALQGEVRVIPVLADDATLPREDELPDSLTDLVARQAIQIRFDRYRDDISHLIGAIERVLGGQAPKKLARVSEQESVPDSRSESRKVPSLETSQSDTEGVEGPAVARVEPDLIHVLQHDDAVLRVAFSPDSSLLVTASKDETARLWKDGQQQYQLLHSDSVKDTAFSHDGNLLATVTAADNIVRLWNPQTGLIAYRLTADKPERVLFSPDRELLAVPSGEWDGQIFVWTYTDIWSDPALFRLQTRVLDVDFGNNGLLAIAAFRTALLWNADLGSREDSLIHREQVNSVDFNKDGTLITTASNDETARIWDSQTGQEYHRLRHGERVELALFSPESSFVATVSGDNAYIWDPKTGYKHEQLQHDDDVQGIQFSPDGQLLVTCSGSAAHIWNPGTGEKYHQLQHDHPVQEIQFSPDGQLLVTCSGSAAQVWHVQGS